MVPYYWRSYEAILSGGGRLAIRNSSSEAVAWFAARICASVIVH